MQPIKLKKNILLCNGILLPQFNFEYWVKTCKWKHYLIGMRLHEQESLFTSRAMELPNLLMAMQWSSQWKHERKSTSELKRDGSQPVAARRWSRRLIYESWPSPVGEDNIFLSRCPKFKSQTVRIIC